MDKRLSGTKQIKLADSVLKMSLLCGNYEVLKYFREKVLLFPKSFYCPEEKG